MPIAAGIHYEAAGTGALPLLCMHGIGGAAESFRAQLEALADRRRVLSWTLPGYGASEPLSELTFAALADAVCRLLDALETGRAHLCGHSLGGMIAIEAAIRHPDRVASVALMGTTPAFGGRDHSFRDAFLKARLGPLDAGVTMAELAKGFVQQIAAPDAPEAALAPAIATMARVPPAEYRRVLGCLVTFNRREGIGALDLPVACIAGAVDQTAPARTMAKMAAAIRGAAFHEIPDCGHLIPQEAPDAANAILRDFLKDKP